MSMQDLFKTKPIFDKAKFNVGQPIYVTFPDGKTLSGIVPYCNDGKLQVVFVLSGGSIEKVTFDVSDFGFEPDQHKIKLAPTFEQSLVTTFAPGGEY